MLLKQFLLLWCSPEWWWWCSPECFLWCSPECFLWCFPECFLWCPPECLPLLMGLAIEPFRLLVGWVAVFLEVLLPTAVSCCFLVEGLPVFWALLVFCAMWLEAEPCCWLLILVFWPFLSISSPFSLSLSKFQSFSSTSTYLASY